ncbi:3-ketoacyl-CoA thiolase [Labilithrix luteola]|uniref:3-ketoacyl-CoA thiolase n=1 Tax=Labilithrix luteola TaxID=1391654 RepID=A0A0K1QDC9_9BACT|nr:acetyl-CoA C-acetyltransferase [Labilithrix luteola]AKV03718.1 3-ketoacyl-CoA thiolase [Labilithrix luteola]
MSNAFIIGTSRTPRGRGKAGKGALSGIHPQELLAQTLNQLAKKTGVDPKNVDDVVAGIVSQAGEQGSNLARNTVLAAGWPIEVGGTSVNRFCGSGLQAINFAAMGVMSGMQGIVAAGGVESMSRVPMGSDGGGVDGLNTHLRKTYYQVPQGISADLIATREGFTRQDVDNWALRSQQRAGKALEDKREGKAIFPVVDPATGNVVLANEEYPRPTTTMEALAKLEPAFLAMGATPLDGNDTFDQVALRPYPGVGSINHVHTAGNSSGIVDGAAAVLLASDEAVKQYGLKPRARIRSFATIGSEPVIMLTAPAPASQKALKLAGMNAKDIDLWEINEAFAAVVLQTIRALEIDPERVNVNGGSIALGHPLGATGAILLGTALDELERTNKSTALITLCIGGGQGIATIIERV